jgi:hypothetical protein
VAPIGVISNALCFESTTPAAKGEVRGSHCREIKVMVVVPAVASASAVTSIYVPACVPTVRVASCQRSVDVRLMVAVLLLVSSSMVKLPLFELLTPLR